MKTEDLFSKLRRNMHELLVVISYLSYFLGDVVGVVVVVGCKPGSAPEPRAGTRRGGVFLGERRLIPAGKGVVGGEWVGGSKNLIPRIIVRAPSLEMGRSARRGVAR